MGSTILKLYDDLRRAANEEEKDRIIAEAFDALDDRYPHLGNIVTRTDLSETELRLQKEIAETNQEIAKTNQEIAKTNQEIAKVEASLKLDIADVKKDIADVKMDIADLKISSIKWLLGFILAQTGLLISAMLMAFKLFNAS